MVRNVHYVAGHGESDSAIASAAAREARSTTAANTSNLVIVLTSAIIALSLVTAMTGLFWTGGEAPETFTTVRGESVEIYGEGIYRHDSVIRATANKGADVVTLAIALPLLIGSLVWFRRGTLRGRIMMFGALIWFLYNSASLALGTAFNELFLVYVALMSASLFAFILLFRSIDPGTLADRLTSLAPRRGLAMFMFFTGLVTLVVWLEAPMRSLIQNQPPGVLEHSTTLITHALDLAIILPAAILAGVLILRNDPLGHVIAMPILVIVALLAPMIAMQTAFQLLAEVEIPVTVAIGPIGGFMVIAVIAIWFAVRMMRSISTGDSRGINPGVRRVDSDGRPHVN